MFVGQKINVLFTFIREVARSHPSSGGRQIGQSVSNTTLNRLMLIYFSILGKTRKHLSGFEQWIMEVEVNLYFVYEIF